MGPAMFFFLKKKLYETLFKLQIILYETTSNIYNQIIIENSL